MQINQVVRMHTEFPVLFTLAVLRRFSKTCKSATFNKILALTLMAKTLVYAYSISKILYSRTHITEGRRGGEEGREERWGEMEVVTKGYIS
jgi:hypothetical protein